ncbi:MAG TPA: hypothetical protein VF520_16095 [Thermoleophilaceae bacterium]|jgi:hypothetical protein
MSLLDRLRGDREPGTRERPSLARDARSMRATLAALHAERGGGEVDLKALVRDLLDGEVEAPTADVRQLIVDGVTAGRFYSTEIAPNWEGLDELRRADKLDQFLDLARMVEASPDALPAEMAATLRTKLLLLAWGFDEEHGYLGRMARGEGAG